MATETETTPVIVNGVENVSTTQKVTIVKPGKDGKGGLVVEAPVSYRKFHTMEAFNRVRVLPALAEPVGKDADGAPKLGPLADSLLDDANYGENLHAREASRRKVLDANKPLMFPAEGPAAKPWAQYLPAQRAALAVHWLNAHAAQSKIMPLEMDENTARLCDFVKAEGTIAEKGGTWGPVAKIAGGSK